MPLIVGSTSSVKEFYKNIPNALPEHTTLGNGYYIFPCDQTLPAVSFKIGGESLAMNPSTLSLGKVEGQELCVGSVVAVDGLATDHWLVGAAFMKNYYTIFDYGKSRIGFATLA
jgi:hypothetical protein